jgi:hypothetical protein
MSFGYHPLIISTDSTIPDAGSSVNTKHEESLFAIAVQDHA